MESNNDVATDGLDDCVDFYHVQSYQSLGEKQFQVDILLDVSLHPSWLAPIDNAAEDINRAAPGICLTVINRRCSEVVSNNKYTMTIKGETNRNEGTYTLGNVLDTNEPCDIILNDHWEAEEKNGTALHEILHALGFEHEHQRHDAGNYLDIIDGDFPDGFKEQYGPVDGNLGLSRFDPFSVMLYPCIHMTPKPDSDKVWKLKPNHHQQDQQLSELDKIGLNLLFRPVLHSEFLPKQSEITGLNYCGRTIMCRLHSNINGTEFKLQCGPDRGPNCPACRVLETEKSNELERLGKWQGWTGFVYCGRTINDEGVLCGPDNGKPCQECYKMVYPRVSFRDRMMSLVNCAHVIVTLGLQLYTLEN